MKKIKYIILAVIVIIVGYIILKFAVIKKPKEVKNYNNTVINYNLEKNIEQDEEIIDWEIDLEDV